MKKKKKFDWKKNIGLFISLLFGAIIGIVLGVFLNKFDFDMNWYEELLYTLFLIIGVYVAYIVQIIIHEAGHLVFGLLTDYKFSSFRIFSIMLIKENNKLRVKNFSLAGTAGQCLMLPPEMKDGKIPVVLYNLGGSFMNIIACLFFTGAYLLCSDVPYLNVILLLLAVVGFLSALLNGIPMCMGTVNNDGYNAISLSRNPDAIKAFWIQLKIVEQTAKGIRLKDMPDEWFVLPNDYAMKNSMVATQGVFACNRLMDAQQFDEADNLMKHLLEIESGMVSLHRSLLICDRICVELIKDNRSNVIKNMLSKELKSFMKSMKNYPTIIRTEYALALLYENDLKKAEKCKILFDKRAKTYPYPNELISERDFMSIAERVYNNEQTSKVI